MESIGNFLKININVVNKVYVLKIRLIIIVYLCLFCR